MASRRFFAYDPYDYYYATPYQYAYPYYRHQQPAPARSVGGFSPVAGDAEPAAVGPAARPRSWSGQGSRSVSISVHSVGSDPEPERNAAGSSAEPVARMAAMAPAAVVKKRAPSVEEAAVRLQAAMRGYLARRTVRAVREVEREAEEVAARVAREAEALRGDARARVAVGEVLMRLLLRLDAVRGAREFRKMVTKRVLALQDAVDALEPKPVAVAEETETEAAADEMVQESPVAPELPDAAERSGEAEAMTHTAAADAEMEIDGTAATGSTDAEEEMEPASDGVNHVADKPEDADVEGEWDMVTEEPAAEAAAVDPRPQVPTEEEIKRTGEAGGTGGVDTRKVMEMVAALYERSAQQCAVIGALAERVDALERAVRRVEDGERRRRRAKKLRKEAKGSNHNKCYID